MKIKYLLFMHFKVHQNKKYKYSSLNLDNKYEKQKFQNTYKILHFTSLVS